ncbi:MAG: antibiotic biosynthesis monooxygenase [Deltaproteobacteria bacterium]|nr:antibiotic biosynthesis monooxygenase [Deltaproteobacteria bacterium]
MLVVLVHVRVRQECVDDFRKATVENAWNSELEPGIARFDVIVQADDPTRFVLVEVYRDADTPARHKETAHYKAWKEAVEPMMADPRQGVRYSTVFPGDEEW